MRQVLIRATNLGGLNLLLFMAGLLFSTQVLPAQTTRLLRHANLHDTHVAFVYGADVWVSKTDGSELRRLSNTPAVESYPHISPDGQSIAFSSNRSGSEAVYLVPISGGIPKRITWHPSGARVQGWTPEGNILYASNRETAPKPYNRLWSISPEGGNPTLISPQWAVSGSYSPDGKQMAIDRMSRWDIEWRAYRGGQNTPLVILNLEDQSEVLLPNEKTTDTQPYWMEDKIYFLSDRDWVMNIWAYTPATKSLEQITKFEGSDIKWLTGNGNTLFYERDGNLYFFTPETGETTQFEVSVAGDFPWAARQWEDVSRRINGISLSPSGKRAAMSARGEIFSVPMEYGSPRNLTVSSDADDRIPLWSPKGDQIAWFSESHPEGYDLILAPQDGMGTPKKIDIGSARMVWEPTWSPDGRYIAFVDDDVQLTVLDLEQESIQIIDTAGINIERGSMGLTWAPDGKWLAYSKTSDNHFGQIKVWSAQDGKIRAVTDAFADAKNPAWDMDKQHLYFLASTNLALRSGWTNTSSMNARPQYAAYVINLQDDIPSPFELRSDEEGGSDKEGEAQEGKMEESKEEKKKGEKKKQDKGDGEEEAAKKPAAKPIKIDFDQIARRTIALPVPVRNYVGLEAGSKGKVYLVERVQNKPGVTVHAFTLKDRKAEVYVDGVRSLTLSGDKQKMLIRRGPGFQLLDTRKPAKAGKPVKVNLQMKVDRQAEWMQIYNEAWRYERDFFYDPNMHGRDWQTVYERYAPLIPHIRHRWDLTYILDQLNGELSVGHSFVGGGDYPDIDQKRIGLLGADFRAHNGRWQITRIFTTETWNPNLTSPLDQPGVDVKKGYYLVGINGRELSASDNLFESLDGTLNQQTVLHINKEASFEGSWTIIAKPISSETALRQRAWVEDNRRLVDSLSNGQLAYVWVPNTSGQGLVSFNRYFFAQQDKKGAVIDERFNGGGLLDDYMVDLMTRKVRAAYTNEVPGGKPGLMPAGILGPKALLINELSGSGGDFFPWVFRHQQAGPLIGATTWGGLVKSSTHYLMVDGGRLTAPDNAIYDPIEQEWIGENKGIAPDIPVRQDAQALQAGRDPQLERAVSELLKLLPASEPNLNPPAYSTPAVPKK